ncbi:putative ammonium transporter 1 [Bacillus rossius redtenbacheri]|uniref:putative ammonium transporter 1 n=1 Tax=Bacillus rossius redtenbacheri TaxID=93214 RepID=UPI002FDDF4B2
MNVSNHTVDELDYLKKNIDDVFLLTNGIIVSLMQCGFACLEAGSVRSKNATNIIMKNVFDMLISAVAYWLVGYAIAYGDGNAVLGLTHWAGAGLRPHMMAHWFFQFVFAATAATIMSGAVAERCNYVAYIAYSAVVSGLVYPMVSHWVWSPQGWLLQLGYKDFAGSGAVHLLGGTCSLVAAVFLGPRIGRFDGKLGPELFLGHSTPLVGVGGLLLFSGFLAFNGGSLGSMAGRGDGGVISTVVANTVMGGSGGGLLVLAGSRLGLFGDPAWSFAITLNAALAGMVSVCGAPDELLLWSSFVTGAIAGLVYIALHYVVLKLRIDDPLDAVAVHLGGGFWGLMAASIFSRSGLVYGATTRSAMLLVYRLVGAAAIFLWSGAACCVMFWILSAFDVLRVSEDHELQGLDVAMHGEVAYPPTSWEPDFRVAQPAAATVAAPDKTRERAADNTRQEKFTSRSSKSLPPVAEYHNAAFVIMEHC